MITTIAAAAWLVLSAACVLCARSYARRAEIFERAADKALQRAQHRAHLAEVYTGRAEAARAETARLLGAADSTLRAKAEARERVWRTLGKPAEVGS